jgi:hypothetical protein
VILIDLAWLQNGQSNLLMTLGLCFLGGGLDDFLFPMTFYFFLIPDVLLSLNVTRRILLIDLCATTSSAQGQSLNFSLAPQFDHSREAFQIFAVDVFDDHESRGHEEERHIVGKQSLETFSKTLLAQKERSQASGKGKSKVNPLISDLDSPLLHVTSCHGFASSAAGQSSRFVQRSMVHLFTILL